MECFSPTPPQVLLVWEMNSKRAISKLLLWSERLQLQFPHVFTAFISPVSVLWSCQHKTVTGLQYQDFSSVCPLPTLFLLYSPTRLPSWLWFAAVAQGRFLFSLNLSVSSHLVTDLLPFAVKLVRDSTPFLYGVFHIFCGCGSAVREAKVYRTWQSAYGLAPRKKIV